MRHYQNLPEQLYQCGHISIEEQQLLAQYLNTYPNKRHWLNFIDKTLLVLGMMTAALAILFFVAFNWYDLGKMGKFAFVQGGLILTIIGYCLLAYKQRYPLLQQLLLLVASLITGGLLALFGQVYQTGADPWQLFALWALLIIPWALLARLPALWLLWLGLLNTSLLLYTKISLWFIFADDFILWLSLAVLNTAALLLWLYAQMSPMQKPDTSSYTAKILPLHWSTYITAMLSCVFVTWLFLLYVSEIKEHLYYFLMALIIWTVWAVWWYWRFCLSRLNVLMLTLWCASILAVLFRLVDKLLGSKIDTILGLLFMSICVLGASSMAVAWLRRLYQQSKVNTLSIKTEVSDAH